MRRRPRRDEGIRRRLHVAHVAEPSSEGVAVVQYSYIREQLRRGWRVTVVCPSHGWLGYSARAAGAEVRWWSATRGPGRSVLRETTELRRILAEVDPDVVHLHSAKAGLAGRLALRGSRPTIFQPHAWSFLAVEGPVRRASLAWERLAARWTHRLVCVSEAERIAGVEAGIEVPTRVLPNGVDLLRLGVQGPQERLAARAGLGLPDVPTVVCVGRLTRQKGQDALLDAWPSVRERVPAAQLVLVGAGPDRRELERRAADLDGVLLAGGRTDVPLWLAAADVAVAPSRWEGMPLVPLEAMACGRSVVATAIPGIVEAVPDDAGQLVAPGDAEALADALVYRLQSSDVATDEGWAGRLHVEDHHDELTAAREVIGVYLSVLRERRSRGARRRPLPAVLGRGPGASGT
ncbi:glycosyltransferase [Nocardioides sp. SOB77]|uniref:Glycosyltransferase n=1 Tax=Nocardioides oceani TaxID=3058369 RepID=A0ABT8FIN7_9ACTN|nr:glycosyltransferase [Nocardioides oceani]MDN4174401.1 glycosyltransferase [Nocardioides oceani]